MFPWWRENVGPGRETSISLEQGSEDPVVSIKETTNTSSELKAPDDEQVEEAEKSEENKMELSLKNVFSEPKEPDPDPDVPMEEMKKSDKKRRILVRRIQHRRSLFVQNVDKWFNQK